MKQHILYFIYFLFFNLIACSSKNETDFIFDSLTETIENKIESPNLHFIKTVGNLKLYNTFGDDYQVYFHIPIKYKNQVPIYINIFGENVLSYKFIKTQGPNVLGIAKMRGKNILDFFNRVDTLKWVSYTISKESSQIENFNNFDENLNQWLQNSNCVQINDIKFNFDSLDFNYNKFDANDILVFFDKYRFNYECFKDESKFYFDAYSTFKWGSTCVGLTNLSVALFRKLNIPARSIIILPSSYNNFLDLHWITEYFINGKWINFEATKNKNNYNSSKDVILYLNYLEDEFPKFYIDGINAKFYTSNPEYEYTNPNWARAHKSKVLKSFKVPEDTLNLLFDEYSKIYNNIIEGKLKNKKSKFYNEYIESIKQFSKLNYGNTLATIKKINVDFERTIKIDFVTVYEETFENENKWVNENKLKFNNYKITNNGKSQNNCFGIRLDENKSMFKSSIISPKIQLPKSEKINMSFDVWSVLDAKLEKNNLFSNLDEFWVEIIENDKNLSVPILKSICGGNYRDDVPSYGGWSKIYLDISEFTGKNISLKFTFEYKGGKNSKEVYIDNILIEKK